MDRSAFEEFGFFSIIIFSFPINETLIKFQL